VEGCVKCRVVVVVAFRTRKLFFYYERGKERGENSKKWGKETFFILSLFSLRAAALGFGDERMRERNARARFLLLLLLQFILFYETTPLT